MSGMSYAPAVSEDKVAEFDLTLVRPGKWILQGYTLPGGHWYQRQAHAINYAHFQARDCGTMIIRLHNAWAGADSHFDVA